MTNALTGIAGPAPAPTRSSIGTAVSDSPGLQLVGIEECKMSGYSRSRTLNKPDATGWTRDDFLAMFSHEIRNSTQIIISWAELMCMRSPGDAALTFGLDVIRRNGRLQTRLLNQLLAFLRNKSDDLWTEARRISLQTVLETAINTMAPQALAKKIKLKAELDPSVGLIIGDAVQLEEVFTNLLSNAIKFTPDAGAIEVRLRCWNGLAEITVKDSGKGISPEFLPFVFERFRQENGDRAKEDGLGLGLAITRYLVERHHGQIYAFSSGVGLGATFKVLLPLAYEELPGSPPAQGTTPTASAQLAE
jgi:signal transduction histidine kinase